ncbi:MAG: hypothetical protein NT033_05250 [Candidatus Omnitrophica bacterium]|nr:hypothetical protein [Candidatus Omnitrophota bacterium]
MRRINEILGIALVLILCFAGFVCAKDHVALTVTCSIPAVPGLNAPLVEETKPAAKENKDNQQVSKVEKKSQQETVVDEKSGEQAAVKTYYSR